MRGSSCVFLVLLAACGGHETGHDELCSVVLVRPGDATDEISLRPELRVEWSTAVDLEQSVISLREFGGDAIPMEVIRDGDRAARLVVQHSLRFDSVYALEVSPVAAVDSDQGTCTGATTAFHTVVPREVEQPLRTTSLEGLAQVGNYVIGASRAFRGLQVFDVTQPDQPALVATLPTDIHAAGVFVDGDRAFVPGEQDGVLILEVSDPTRPRELGRIGTPGMAMDVAPFHRAGVPYVAIADGIEGVRIVDVTDAAAPRTVAVFDPSGVRAADVRAVDVDGALLAVADGSHGYVVADITNPAAPTLVARGIGDSPAIDVALDRGLVYVSHFPAFVDVFDSTQPGLPRVGGVRACDVCMVRYPVYLHRSGELLYATAARDGVRTYALDGAGGMDLLGTRRTEGPAFSVVETSNRIYVGEEGGLATFDRLAFTGPRFFDPNGYGTASSITLIDDLAYVAASSRGVQVFDTSDVEHPALLARFGTPASSSGDTSAAFATATQQTLFVGDVRGGLVSFDRATDPVAPTLMGQVQATDGIAKMVPVRDGVVLACQGNTGMVLADVSDRAAPQIIAERFFRDIANGATDYCIDVVFDETTQTGYVAGNLGITVLEVGGPTAEDPLRVVGRFPLPSRDRVLSLARRGRLLYAATQVSDFEGRHGVSSRLQIVDISDPHVPVWRWSTDDLGQIGSLLLVDDIAFSAARELGVYVFDLSGDVPVIESLVPTRGDAVSFAATPDALYVVEGTGGLGVIHTGALPVPRQ